MLVGPSIWLSVCLHYCITKGFYCLCWQHCLIYDAFAAIRFTFQAMALATPDDYVIVSNSPIPRRGLESELAVVS